MVLVASNLLRRLIRDDDDGIAYSVQLPGSFSCGSIFYFGRGSRSDADYPQYIFPVDSIYLDAFYTVYADGRSDIPFETRP